MFYRWVPRISEDLIADGRGVFWRAIPCLSGLHSPAHYPLRRERACFGCSLDCPTYLTLRATRLRVSAKYCPSLCEENSIGHHMTLKVLCADDRWEVDIGLNSEFGSRSAIKTYFHTRQRIHEGLGCAGIGRRNRRLRKRCNDWNARAFRVFVFDSLLTSKGSFRSDCVDKKMVKEQRLSHSVRATCESCESCGLPWYWVIISNRAQDNRRTS